MPDRTINQMPSDLSFTLPSAHLSRLIAHFRPIECFHRVEGTGVARLNAQISEFVGDDPIGGG